MPPFLGIGHPTLGSPGQRGVPGSPGRSLRRTSVPARPLPRGLCPLPSHCPPASSLSPLKSLDCEALDTQGALVPGFPGLSLCTSGRGPYLVFTHTSFVFLFLLIQGGCLK